MTRGTPRMRRRVYRRCDFSWKVWASLIPSRFFGPETHNTEIVPLALGVQARNDVSCLKSVYVDTPSACVNTVEQPPKNANGYPPRIPMESLKLNLATRLSTFKRRPVQLGYISDHLTRILVLLYSLQSRAIQLHTTESPPNTMAEQPPAPPP
ncbi:hypothetical protein M378DRAFT_161890 [Amanita muscaria Koide BX008]|uniref:Uncharacterized protein n=1 Tax=Amanita muscaria (strain Koide BX008) TaxID=946122 RepID=A0A0C2SQN0_AMAMK|nr:hypothetical protein M378DRAFT_161890 [Amanita muscaria Koide BX008]